MNRSILWRVLLTVLICLSLTPLAAIAAEVEVTVSDKEVYFGQPVFLEFTVRDAEDSSTPQLPEITGAKVTYVGTSQQLSITNNRRQQSLTHRFQLTPDAAGTLVIPPFDFRIGSENFRFAGTRIEVMKSDSGDLLFVDVVVDRDSYFVGEQVRATLEIWVRPYRDREYNVKLDVEDMRMLLDMNASRWGVFEDRLRQRTSDRLGLPGQKRQREISQGISREYYVYTVQHDFWADQPGAVDVGDIRVVFEYPEELAESRDVFSSFFDRGNLRISRSRPVVGEVANLSIKINPLPTEGRPDTFNGAVGSYELKVSAKPREVRVGDPITLNLNISGRGRLETLQAPPFDRIRELAENFSFPSEPLAGVVQGEVKQFTQTIRAKREEVTEVPKLPFSYFDPEQGRYQTVWSDPIPLRVSSAERMSSGDIVEAAGPADAPAPSSSLTAVQEGLVASYHQIDELLIDQEFKPGPGTVVVLAAPPVIVAGVWLGIRRLHKVRGDVTAARRREARRKADQLTSTLHAPKPPAEFGALLLSYLNDRLGLPPGVRTRGEIAEALQSRRIPPDLKADFDRLIGEVESLHYGGGNSVPVELAEAVSAAIRKLEQHS